MSQTQIIRTKLGTNETFAAWVIKESYTNCVMIDDASGQHIATYNLSSRKWTWFQDEENARSLKGQFNALFYDILELGVTRTTLNRYTITALPIDDYCVHFFYGEGTEHPLGSIYYGKFICPPNNGFASAYDPKGWETILIATFADLLGEGDEIVEEYEALYANTSAPKAEGDWDASELDCTCQWCIVGGNCEPQDCPVCFGAEIDPTRQTFYENGGTPDQFLAHALSIKATKSLNKVERALYRARLAETQDQADIEAGVGTLEDRVRARIDAAAWQDYRDERDAQLSQAGLG